MKYIEVLTRFSNEIVAVNVAEPLTTLPNVNKTEVYYRWNLIAIDPDDNKFVDLAISSNADFIVTNDSHFNVLKEISFPKINIMSIEDFLEAVKKL